MAAPDAKPRVSGRGKRATPDLLKKLRHLRVAVFHPKDADGEMLTGQLQRIGCHALTFWPPLEVLPDTVDVVFCAVRPELAARNYAWARAELPPAIVAVIDYENPTILDAVLELGAQAVLTTPLRSSGVLSSLVMALAVNDEMKEGRKRVARLEKKLLAANQISEAKLILMRTRQVSDTEAYRLIREQAMSKRVGTEEIASAIIQADAVLNYRERD
ncbi:ANTAR domain-containing protein [Aquabacterium soli]|uniref:ANTAR domain-containing protein n=1 Tax=Aquabacterium soli TaxID=2493092 RepID=A0A3R8T338_9BURK|nr:ANTAR domain-containing protein [Aquabacterium soli]RRS02875.1 ANTAR domain-containing protein [Aquabacterium soli]